MTFHPYAALLALCACAAAGAAPTAAPLHVDTDAMLSQITTLASDEFEGRAPGSHGETLTIDYLQQQLKKLGLEPGNPDGTYLQAVPMVGISTHPTLSYRAGAGAPVKLAYPEQFVAWSARTEKQLNVADSDLVFVGYGITAPQYQWDDYKGVDLHGKTLVVLINDPPLPDPKHPKQLDASQFGGKALTWYGRWNYKFEMAAKLGAAAVLIVHDTKPAGYPYEVVRASLAREVFTIKSKGPNPAFPPLAGWLPLEQARAMFKAGGQDFDQLQRGALSRDFKPVALGVKVSLSAQNSWREVASNNVVAKVTGSDPALKNEVVLYSAHWDHFGIDTTLPGPRTQQIFHGARDNASGVAALLAVAKAYKALPTAPKRSIVFLFTTGEERGLLGAQYYARNPLYPLNKTVLDLNVDGINLWGRTRDVELVGMGRSDAEEVVVSAAKAQGRTVHGEINPELGTYFRNDQLEFARAGVPALILRGGAQYTGAGAAAALAKRQAYTANQYHTVHDVVEADWDLRGAAQDIALLYEVGHQVAQGGTTPQWKPGAEFKAAREQSLAARPK
ncbi:M20/M25/M40 family metallo-hydrolase [Rugamonas apoptosis]|uniref:M20/M25/M40 family metallo-hydrolase n=1 Tax=Rugamonas apoptosis TaxID=2758570 RepID=A0A7W2F6P0_9BURK|nr:M20/M25/M40 family metallo-hydrolase [Rugamonas apoptosis]MBA5686107.1 M20/M25/M40 family metallo-hydrolase [Rugamonas apoptosis]